MTNTNELVRKVFEKHSMEKSPDLELFDTDAIINELSEYIDRQLSRARIEASIDENSKWLQVAQIAKDEFNERGLSQTLPVESMIREHEKRIVQLKQELKGHYNKEQNE